jgi:hypothetical protein
MKIFISLLFSISTLIGFAQVQMPDCKEIEYWIKEVELKFKNTPLTTKDGIITSSRKMKASGSTKFMVEKEMNLYAVMHDIPFSNENDAALATENYSKILKACTIKLGFSVDSESAMRDATKGIEMIKYKSNSKGASYSIKVNVDHIFDDESQKWVMLIAVVRSSGGGAG